MWQDWEVSFAESSGKEASQEFLMANLAGGEIHTSASEEECTLLLCTDSCHVRRPPPGAFQVLASEITPLLGLTPAVWVALINSVSLRKLCAVTVSQGCSTVPTHCTQLTTQFIAATVVGTSESSWLSSLLVGGPQGKATWWGPMAGHLSGRPALLGTGGHSAEEGPWPSIIHHNVQNRGSSQQRAKSDKWNCQLYCAMHRTQTRFLYVQDLFEQSEQGSGELWAPCRLSPYCRWVKLTQVHSQTAAKIDFFGFSTFVCPTELTLPAYIL